jgi:hypothetical protein
MAVGGHDAMAAAETARLRQATGLPASLRRIRAGPDDPSRIHRRPAGPSGAQGSVTAIVLGVAALQSRPRRSASRRFAFTSTLDAVLYCLVASLLPALDRWPEAKGRSSE